MTALPHFVVVFLLQFISTTWCSHSMAASKNYHPHMGRFRFLIDRLNLGQQLGGRDTLMQPL